MTHRRAGRRSRDVACYTGAQGSRLAVRPRVGRAARTATFAQTGLGPTRASRSSSASRRNRSSPTRNRSSSAGARSADAFAVRAEHARSRDRARAARDRAGCCGSRGDAAATAATRVRPSTPRSATRPAPRNRSASGASDAGPVEFVPPDGVLPGQVGTLVDEHANLVDVTATIVDLAVRGWLTITDLDERLRAHRDPGRRARARCSRTRPS